MTDKLRELTGAGLMFIIGGTFVLFSMRLPIGSPQNMGPGFLPLAVSAIICGFSAILGLNALRNLSGSQEDFPRFDRTCVRGIALIAAGVGSFILLIPIFGLIPAVFVATLSLAQSRHGLKMFQTIAVSTFVTFVVWLIFIAFLGLPISPFEINVPWTF